MLINPETQKKVEDVVAGVAAALSVYALGRELGEDRPMISATIAVAAAGKLTPLEQSYVAGRIAGFVGADQLRKMSEGELRTWIEANNFVLTPLDAANLTQLKTTVGGWVQGRSDAWRAEVRQQIAKANLEWKSVLETRTFQDAAEKAELRGRAIESLSDEIRDSLGVIESDVDRLVQTSIVDFFQRGQITEFGSEEMVYKVPRPTACRYCMELHLNADGTPKMYRLGDILGSSNVGARAYDWGFTIGPVHPHCYCVLYRVSERPPSLMEGLVGPRQAIRSKKR